jgi:integrase
LTITADRGETETPYFRPHDALRIIAGAKEPCRTIFALAWCTGLRAGELLGLTRGDLDFERKLIIPRKQADETMYSGMNVSLVRVASCGQLAKKRQYRRNGIPLQIGSPSK